MQDIQRDITIQIQYKKTHNVLIPQPHTALLGDIGIGNLEADNIGILDAGKGVNIR